MEVTQSEAEFLRKQFIHDLTIEHQSFLGVIKACPEDKLSYRPHDKTFTFAEQATHTYGAMLFFANMIDKLEAKKGETPTTKEGLIGACQSIFDEFISRVKNMSTEQIAAQYPFFVFGTEAGIRLLQASFKHLIHHRAQMQLYVRLMNEKCPSVYGPTADVSFEELSKAGA